MIDVSLGGGCNDDEVTNLTSISDILYYIAEDGLVKFEATWSNIEPSCPTDYLVTRIVEGTERDLTEAEKLVLTHHKLTTGMLDLQTSDYALDGEVWKIKLFMRSTYSKLPENKRNGIYVFEIEFRDICWDSDLTAAQFVASSLIYDVW